MTVPVIYPFFVSVSFFFSVDDKIIISGQFVGVAPVEYWTVAVIMTLGFFPFFCVEGSPIML